MAVVFFFFQAEDGIRDYKVTGVQTCALPISGAMDSLGARRPQMMAVLDRAMELGARRQREAESGQHGLFVSEGDPAPAAPEDLPNVPEWSEAERLAGEKEVLGFYVTGHPLEKY